MLAARIAGGGADPGYKRHQPKKTLLYQIVDRYYLDFLAQMDKQGAPP